MRDVGGKVTTTGEQFTINDTKGTSGSSITYSFVRHYSNYIDGSQMTTKLGQYTNYYLVILCAVKPAYIDHKGVERRQDIGETINCSYVFFNIKRVYNQNSEMVGF